MVGLDWLAATAGMSVRIWGWVVLGLLAAVLMVQQFARRFYRIAAPSMLVQLAAEVLLLAALITVAAWEWFFADAPGTADHKLGVELLVTSSSAMVASLAIPSIREPHPRFSLLGLAALPAITAPPVLLYLDLTGRASWLGQAWNVLGWSLLLGALLVQIKPRAINDEMQSLRTTVIGSAIGLMVGASVSALLVGQRTDRLTWLMIAVVVATMISRDIVQTQRTLGMTAQLREQAMLDPLTGLANRRALDAWVNEQAKSDPSSVSVVTLDLDQFKDVNDLLGHNTGDELLRVTAHSLRELAEQSNSRVFRMGGDEFIVVCRLTPAAGELLARQLIQVVDEANSQVPGVSRLALGASVGVRHVSVATPEALADAITQSSQAMRAAKQAGKGRVLIFDDSLQTDYRRRKVVELRLREQLDQVSVHYQPILDDTGRVSGFEALGRWTDPELGVVPPAEFVPVAEHANLIADLGMSILTRAIADMTSSGLLGDQRRLNVNVSALQLRFPSFVDRVFDLVDSYGLPRRQLVLELTESTTVQHDGPVGIAMDRLASGGVRLAIDDFGAGATSVGYLSRLPVSSVKIDRSLTMEVGDEATAGIVRGLIEMCRGLGLAVVLEGVETHDQERRAEMFGVDYLQGWLYSKAVPLEELPSVLERLAARPAHLTTHHTDDLAQLARSLTSDQS